MSEFGMSDMGEYHDPALRLERTDLSQQGFEAVYHPFQHDIEDTRVGFDVDGNFHTIRQGIISHLTQQILGESVYKPDMQWEMWHQTRRLEDENALPHGVTAEDLFQHYLRVYEGE